MLKKLILFDLVSTLTQAGPRYTLAYQRVCEQYGLNIPNEDDLLNALGNKNLKQIIADHSPELDKNRLSQFMTDCNTMCDSILTHTDWLEHLSPGTRDMLLQLNDLDVSLGIYTGTREDALFTQLRYHNIEHFFDPKFCIGKDNIRDGMIAPCHLKEKQIEHLKNQWLLNYPQSSVKDIVMIGDSVADYAAATAQNISFIAFAPTTEKQQIFKEKGVDYFIDHLEKLPPILSNNFSCVVQNEKPTIKYKFN